MGLSLVSESYMPDRGPREPANAPHYPLTPPVDLSSSQTYTQGHPFAAYAQMQKDAPVMWHPMPSTEGFWAITAYEDVRTVNLDARLFSSQKGGILQAYFNEGSRHPELHRASLDTLICLDAPHHAKLRREHMSYFTANYVKDLKVKVDAKVAELLDGLETTAKANGGTADLVPHLSEKLPLFTLCEILGIPEVDHPKITKWMEMLELAQYTMEQMKDGDMSQLDPAQIMTFMQEVQALFDYGQHMLKARRAEPKNDLLSAIANVEIDGALLPDEYLDGSWLLILFAGNDTTRNSISGTMRLLTEFSEARSELAANLDLMPNAVNEAIRMVSPVIYMRRTATQDTQLRGQTIAEGEKVIIYYGAANRDPSVFENPDVFDLHRSNAKDHIAFGIGPHVCLGQRVANMQLESAYRQILARFPNISWTGEQTIAPNNFTHSVTRLMVDIG